MNNIPYTYLIGWTKLNIWYYGVRYAKDCHPSDLWVRYKTSSNYVKNFVLQHGDPDIVQVRKIFTEVNKARLWEETVLRRMNVINDDKWLNKNNARSIDPTTVPHGDSHWTRNNPKYSKHFSLHGPMSSETTRAKITGDNHYSRKPGYTASNHPMKRTEVIEKVKAAVSGDNHYTHKPNYDNSNHYAKRPQSRQRRSELNGLRKGTAFRKVVCPQCAKEIGANVFPQHRRKCE
jgi:hypothetical protein